MVVLHPQLYRWLAELGGPLLEMTVDNPALPAAPWSIRDRRRRCRDRARPIDLLILEG
jgi:hypothetical protein